MPQNSALDDAIDLIESVKIFRVNDELPFNTVDYMNMDSVVDGLSALRDELAQSKARLAAELEMQIQIIRDTA